MLPEYFEFYNPVKLLCGQWSLENIPYELGRLRVKKPLMLVSGTMLQQGILQMMGEPMPMVLESGIPQDSSFELVERLAAHAREEGCDGVVAIGGGSVLDTAKAVRVLLEQEQTALRRLLGSERMSPARRGGSPPFFFLLFAEFQPDDLHAHPVVAHAREEAEKAGDRRVLEVVVAEHIAPA